MKQLANVLNAILGAGTHRRTTVSNLPKSGSRIWEVRCKHNTRRPTEDRRRNRS